MLKSEYIIIMATIKYYLRYYVGYRIIIALVNASLCHDFLLPNPKVYKTKFTTEQMKIVETVLSEQLAFVNMS